MDGRFVGAGKEAEPVLSDMWFGLPRFAEGIAANLVPSVRAKWAREMLDLAERLFVATGRDAGPPEGPTALHATQVHVGDALCKLVQKHGASEDEAKVEKRKAKYAERIEWAEEFVRLRTWVLDRNQSGAKARGPRLPRQNPPPDLSARRRHRGGQGLVGRAAMHSAHLPTCDPGVSLYGAVCKSGLPRYSLNASRNSRSTRPLSRGWRASTPWFCT